MNNLLFIIVTIYISCNSIENKEGRQLAPPVQEEELCNATFKDLVGSWADSRAVKNIYDFTREGLFPPVNSFVFAWNDSLHKPTLSIQLSEHPRHFVFDSVFFINHKKDDYDSCFVMKDGKVSFLLKLDLKDTTIKDFTLLDSIYNELPPVGHNTFAKISEAPIADIQQFTIGKYLIENEFSIEYQGKYFPVVKQSHGWGYKLKGLPGFDGIQFINWENKSKKHIEVAFSRKGKDYFESMIEKNGQTVYVNYFLEQQSPARYILTRIEKTNRP